MALPPLTVASEDVDVKRSRYFSDYGFVNYALYGDINTYIFAFYYQLNVSWATSAGSVFGKAALATVAP